MSPRPQPWAVSLALATVVVGVAARSALDAPSPATLPAAVQAPPVVVLDLGAPQVDPLAEDNILDVPPAPEPQIGFAEDPCPACGMG